MRKKLVFLFLIFLFIDAPIFSQDITGALEGQIFDQKGQPLSDVHVFVESPSLQGIRGTATNKKGIFQLFALPTGTYDLTITHVSYQGKIFQNIVVSLGKTTSLQSIVLEAQSIEIPELIVMANYSIIDPSSTVAGADLKIHEIDVLPVSRNYRDITSLLPHANQSFFGDEINFGGATGLGNRYVIDGIDVTDPQKASTGTNLPYNFVNEVEVLLGGYEAEYRSALGAIINVKTNQGSNQFRGNAFGFFANNRFSGDPRHGALEPNTGDFSQYDAGFSFGGPIIRDKLWFNASYNPTFEREEVEIPGVGFFLDNATTHIFAGKLNWQASPKTNFSVVVLGDPSRREAVGETYIWWGTPSSFENPDPYLADLQSGGVNLAVKGTHTFSNSFLLEGAYSRINRLEKYNPATQRGAEEPFFLNNELGLWSGGYPMFVDNTSTLSSYFLKGTLTQGDHTIKMGLEYRNNLLDSDVEAYVVHLYSPTFYQIVDISWKGKVANRIPSVFLQDSWRISKAFRLNAGLRWDGQFLMDSDGNLAQRITDQFQPRVGIVYSPGEAGSQKFFGSVGRFYQDISTFLSSNGHSEGLRYNISIFDHDPRMDPTGGQSISFGGALYDEEEGLKGQYFDEVTLGYERLIGKNYKLGLRGIYRTLGRLIEDSPDLETGGYLIGNPGYGRMDHFPKGKRDYTALELTFKKSGGEKFNYLVSYVLSRNYGNYPGLFNTDGGTGFALPNANVAFDYPETYVNSTGLLPNDRTHVFKFSGSYHFDFGLTAGTFLLWQSGTPLSELGGSSIGPPWFAFLRQRGTAGRTPSIFDVNLRFSYNLRKLIETPWEQRLLLDIFHLGSDRTPVNYEQVHYYDIDENGNQINLNPQYNSPTRFQPPMSLRLGIEMSF
jgi:hypothetical protein